MPKDGKRPKGQKGKRAKGEKGKRATEMDTRTEGERVAECECPIVMVMMMK